MIIASTLKTPWYNKWQSVTTRRNLPRKLLQPIVPKRCRYHRPWGWGLHCTSLGVHIEQSCTPQSMLTPYTRCTEYMLSHIGIRPIICNNTGQRKDSRQCLSRHFNSRALPPSDSATLYGIVHIWTVKGSMEVQVGKDGISKWKAHWCDVCN